MKFHEIPALAQEEVVTSNCDLTATPGNEEDEDEYFLEKSFVRAATCNTESPLCLYDFTIKFVMQDYLVFAVANLSDCKKDDYFYGEGM